MNWKVFQFLNGTIIYYVKPKGIIVQLNKILQVWKKKIEQTYCLPPIEAIFYALNYFLTILIYFYLHVVC